MMKLAFSLLVNGLVAVVLFFAVQGHSKPLKVNEVAFSDCDEVIHPVKDVFDFKVVKLTPVPVVRGKHFSCQVQAVAKRNFSCAEFIVRVSLVRSGLGHEEKDGSESLCDLLLWRSSRMLANTPSEYPSQNIFEGQLYTIEATVNIPPRLETGIYSTRFEIQNKSIHEGSDGCIEFQEVVSKGFQDYLSAAVAFAVALAQVGCLVCSCNRFV